MTAHRFCCPYFHIPQGRGSVRGKPLRVSPLAFSHPPAGDHFCTAKVPHQKRRGTRTCVSSFLELHFCYAKVVACGRVIEREWVNPSKVSPSHSPFLAMCRGADNKICTQSQKKHYLSGGCFLFGMPRAGANTLPRPARSALNQEVRQGSCEWLCHSWDAGSESRHVMRTSPPERWST